MKKQALKAWTKLNMTTNVKYYLGSTQFKLLSDFINAAEIPTVVKPAATKTIIKKAEIKSRV